MNEFAPLNIISGYSFLQSGLTVEKAVGIIRRMDYPGGGLSDRMVLYGVPEFSLLMKSIGKPSVVGMNIDYHGYSVTLFVLNENGYRNLLAVSTAIQKENLTDELVGEHAEGLIAVLETNHGKFPEVFQDSGEEVSFRKELAELSRPFGDRFYLGNEATNREEYARMLRIRAFAKEHAYATVAFPRIRYAKKEDAIVLRIVTAIEKEEKITEKKAEGPEYFMAPADYLKIYDAEEIGNTGKILGSASFEFNEKRGEMLHYPVKDSVSELTNRAESALLEKHLDDPAHKDRLAHELEVIISMGYADYFLLVQDYVSYAKRSGILVGPGRGSSAGSLVAYLLDITEVDPLCYDLQFERFLNPFRKTMPDIDVDFMDVRKDDVVNYMREKYGNDKVANIVTFQTIKAKQSLRDIGRVYGYSNTHIDLLCKRLNGDKISLHQAYKTVPAFRELVDSDAYFLEIVSLASKIENLPRQHGLHAAGILLNNEPLENVLPVMIDFNGNYISQYRMEYLESQGFLKMDFLALRNLTTVFNAVSLINQNHPDLHLDPDQLPFDEKEVYDLISSGATMGVFQLESAGMKRAIRILKPSCFEDVVALLALFRPGPMDSISTYARRKEGKESVSYPSEELKEILSPTYGIIVYQEQINKIATVMAGFSLGEADMFRRAISKKDRNKLTSQEESFRKGAMEKGYPENIITDVFNHILRFAEYGFNKSHSVVYSMLACRMAWLKVHYPLEFYAAILETSSGANDTKFGEYLSEMKARNITVSRPSVSCSGKGFVIVNSNLSFPLSAIRGVDDISVTNILAERENGPFTDYFDFITRMFSHKMSEAVFQKLIDSGAMDDFSPSRQSMRVSLRNALQYAELCQGENGQLNIGIAPFMKPVLHAEEDDPLLNLDREEETIGVMLSDNPLSYKKDLLQARGVVPIAGLREEEGIQVTAGILKAKKVINTKKGTQMAFIKIFDETGELEITVFPTLYSESVSYLENKSILIIGGRFDNHDGERSFLASTIAPLPEENEHEQETDGH